MRLLLGLMVSLYGLGATPFDNFRPALINRPVKAFYNSTNASVALLAAGLSPRNLRGSVTTMAHDSQVSLLAADF
jgi:hypothetical protein